MSTRFPPVLPYNIHSKRNQNSAVGSGMSGLSTVRQRHLTLRFPASAVSFFHPENISVRLLRYGLTGSACAYPLTFVTAQIVFSKAFRTIFRFSLALGPRFGYTKKHDTPRNFITETETEQQ